MHRSGVYVEEAEEEVGLGKAEKVADLVTLVVALRLRSCLRKWRAGQPGRTNEGKTRASEDGLCTAGVEEGERCMVAASLRQRIVRVMGVDVFALQEGNGGRGVESGLEREHCEFTWRRHTHVVSLNSISSIFRDR